jgi:hypothetical protein
MPQRNEEAGKDSEPGYSERLIDHWNPDESWPLNPNLIQLKFKNRIDWVFEGGREAGLCNGEIIKFINLKFGYFKGDIPWGEMPEIREWIMKNAFRFYQYSDPENHKALMQTVNGYSDYFRQMEARQKADEQPKTEW